MNDSLILLAIVGLVIAWAVSKLAAGGLTSFLPGWFRRSTPTGGLSSVIAPGSDAIGHLLAAYESYVRAGDKDKAAKVSAILNETSTVVDK